LSFRFTKFTPYARVVKVPEGSLRGKVTPFHAVELEQLERQILGVDDVLVYAFRFKRPRKGPRPLATPDAHGHHHVLRTTTLALDQGVAGQA